MASTSARQDFPTKSVPRGPIFPGSSIGNNVGSFIKGAGSVSDTAAKEDAGVEPIYGFAEFNKESFNPILSSRPNAIGGQISDSLTGSSTGSTYSSNDPSISNAGQRDDGNSITFMAGANSVQNEGRNEPANAGQFNNADCPDGQTRPWLIWDGGPGINNDCGCWISTGFDILSVLSLAGGIGGFFKILGIGRQINKMKNFRDTTKKALNAWRTQDRGNMYRRYIKRGFSDEEANTLLDITEDSIKGSFEYMTTKSGRLTLTPVDEAQFEVLQTVLAIGAPGALVFAGISNFLDLLTFYRRKKCTARNRTTLNQKTCNCDCDNEQLTETCYEPSAFGSLWTIFANLSNFIPGVNGVFTGDEVEGCDYPCVGCLRSRSVDLVGRTLCDCNCDDSSASIREYYNRHEDMATDCPFEQSFDQYACCCLCPEGTDLHGFGVSKGLYARISDNLGNPATSKEHYLYETGCNYVCDGREQIALGLPWPPECSSGYVWNADPTVCNCVDVCSTGVCVWVVTAYGCGNIDDCTDDEGNPIDDCEYNQAYFTSGEFLTEESAQQWVDVYGHINTVINMVLQGTTTPFGNINTCP